MTSRDAEITLAARGPERGRMSRLLAVPVKDLVNAKQRLIPALSPTERRELARAMLEDVLDALAAAPGGVGVVTAGSGGRAVARAAGVACLAESDNRGHTAAVALAQREAVAAGVARFLTLPGDVPCVTALEIAALVAARSRPPPPWSSCLRARAWAPTRPSWPRPTRWRSSLASPRSRIT